MFGPKFSNPFQLWPNSPKRKSDTPIKRLKALASNGIKEEKRRKKEEKKEEKASRAKELKEKTLDKKREQKEQKKYQETLLRGEKEQKKKDRELRREEEIEEDKRKKETLKETKEQEKEEKLKLYKAEEARRLKFLKISLEDPKESSNLLESIKSFGPLPKREKEITKDLASYLIKLGFTQIIVEAPLPLGGKRADLLIGDEYLIEAKVGLLGLDPLASLKEKLGLYKDLKGCKIIIVIYGDAREDLVERLSLESDHFFNLVILGQIKPVRTNKLKDLEDLKLRKTKDKIREEKEIRAKVLKEALQKTLNLQKRGITPSFITKSQEDSNYSI